MSLASHRSSLPKSACPALSSFFCPDGWGKAWLASAKMMYDHMGLRAERARTIRGIRLGNRKLKAWRHGQQNLPLVQCSEVTRGGFHQHGHGGRKASWQAGETDGLQALPGPASELQGTGAQHWASVIKLLLALSRETSSPLDLCPQPSQFPS